MGQDIETSVWQRLVSNALDRWAACNRISVQSFDDMLNACSQLERTAVVLHCFNQQVNNGGLDQWVANGYLEHSLDTLREVMPKMGETSATIWAELSKCIESHAELSQDEDDDLLYDQMDTFDELFYSLEQKWHNEVCKFFGSMHVMDMA
jgi:hypothetical protein